ncbi:hypothetical protein L914_11865, partial [Phytophthora nicotianae]
IPAKVQRYLKPNFQRKGALRCWNLVHSFRTPLPVVKGLVAACSVEGIRAFADWTKTEHPWRIVDKMFPDVANSFDESDVGWERGHWVVQSEIEATVRRLAKTHGDSSSPVRDATRAMDAYLSDRNRRADKFPWYSYEVLPWILTTADWCSEVAALDEREPWRNCWIDVPNEHPFDVQHSDSTEVSSAAEDEDQDIEEIQSSQGLYALASAAASATL